MYGNVPHNRHGKKVRLLFTLITMESWLSGRKRHPAKVLSSAMGSAGSNPALSVPLTQKVMLLDERLKSVAAFAAFAGSNPAEHI